MVHPNENHCKHGDQGDVEKVVLAANWEDAVQMLELSVCSGDKQEIKRQLDELIEKVETPEEKQQLQDLRKIPNYTPSVGAIRLLAPTRYGGSV
ncbi:MAG: hypothetical protein F6K40_28240 [Okeania sp. SIO3I5]|uniref:hypothetical protein n=1 Tax=Okeania sp. SIO3I5 TaxID=2607805 RepID=UPI0013BCEF93|nr:hypothetical protein [Okeania sp. SIO3I5]NEQ39924.1 hypothetical protein [Okeania sp. SIO3I5]